MFLDNSRWMLNSHWYTYGVRFPAMLPRNCGVPMQVPLHPVHVKVWRSKSHGSLKLELGVSESATNESRPPKLRPISKTGFAVSCVKKAPKPVRRVHFAVGL